MYGLLAIMLGVRLGDQSGAKVEDQGGGSGKGHSIHPPFETRGLYKTMSHRFCACSGVLKISIYCVHKLEKVH